MLGKNPSLVTVVTLNGVEILFFLPLITQSLPCSFLCWCVDCDCPPGCLAQVELLAFSFIHMKNGLESFYFTVSLHHLMFCREGQSAVCLSLMETAMGKDFS